MNTDPSRIHFFSRWKEQNGQFCGETNGRNSNQISVSRRSVRQSDSRESSDKAVWKSYDFVRVDLLSSSAQSRVFIYRGQANRARIGTNRDRVLNMHLYSLIIVPWVVGTFSISFSEENFASVCATERIAR